MSTHSTHSDSLRASWWFRLLLVASHDDDDSCCLVQLAIATALFFATTTLYFWYKCHRLQQQQKTNILNKTPTSSIVGSKNNNRKKKNVDNGVDDDDLYSVLPCIRKRMSRFPKSFLRNPSTPIDPKIITSLLDAALWGPYHGKCYAGCQHPAKFVVLGKESMRQMQHLTLKFYDENYQTVGWPGSCSSEKDAGTGGACSSNKKMQYQSWRQMTYDEIEGRWGPCEYMIAIIMRRQTGPKRLPEWEEAAAVAAATQNMHIQSTKFPQLACYWSSWHDAARDSTEMKTFLRMQQPEDKCLGFFIVAQNKNHHNPANANGNQINNGSIRDDRRIRDRSLMEVEWRS